MSIGAMAQGHMKFKVVEMAWTPRVFAQKLTQTGLTHLGVEDGILTIELPKIKREEGKTGRQIAIS